MVSFFSRIKAHHEGSGRTKPQGSFGLRKMRVVAEPLQHFLDDQIAEEDVDFAILKRCPQPQPARCRALARIE